MANAHKGEEPPGLIPPHGGYRRLRSFQAAEKIYDATVVFCDRFIDKRSRTHDQMVQAARSGRQNIAEGSLASATSKKTELKLTNVARASLGELLLDYEDFLRHRRLRAWEKDSPEARDARRRLQSGEFQFAELEGALPAIFANIMLCLVNQAIYLLGRQIARLEQDFLRNGGFTERLYRKRTEARAASQEAEVLACPRCGEPMVLRTVRNGPRAGSRFRGCRAYPQCSGTRAYESSDRSDKSDKSDRSDRSDKSDRSDDSRTLPDRN